MKTTTTLLVFLFLSVASASAQVKPGIPSDAAARPRTPEQQAILDASTAELQREMGLLGIAALRPPRNATHPDKPNFANYDEAKANPYPDLPPLLVMKDGSKVTTLGQWKKRRAEIKALFDEDVYGKYPAHIPAVTWKVESVISRTVDGVPAIVKHIVGTVDNSSYPAISVQIPADVVTPAATRGKHVPVIIGGGALTTRFSLNGPDPSCIFRAARCASCWGRRRKPPASNCWIMAGALSPSM